MARAIWDDEDKEENEFELMATCPMGVTCVGGLFSFLIGWCVQMLSGSAGATLFAMAAAGAFGIAAGLQGSDPLRMKWSDFMMMFVAIGLLVNVMHIFIPCSNMQTILFVSLACNTAAGSMRPILLIPMTLLLASMGSYFPGAKVLPKKVTC
jgi:hypothetical protein